MKNALLPAAVLALLSAGIASASGQKEQASSRPIHIAFSVTKSGTYDKAAESVTSQFKKETGIDVTIAAFPWATLRQNNTTDLVTGTGKYDIKSGSY